MYSSWPYYHCIMQRNVMCFEYLFLNKELCYQIRAQCKLSMGFYSTITEPVIPKNKMQIMYYHQTHSLSRQVMPFMQRQEVLGLLGRKRKDRRKTGFWQKTALMTERDLSIAQTIPVSHPVIMGFVTQACTSLMLSLHLSLSVYVCTQQSHSATHTHAETVGD